MQILLSTDVTTTDPVTGKQTLPSPTQRSSSTPRTADVPTTPPVPSARKCSTSSRSRLDVGARVNGASGHRIDL